MGASYLNLLYRNGSHLVSVGVLYFFFAIILLIFVLLKVTFDPHTGGAMTTAEVADTRAEVMDCDSVDHRTGVDKPPEKIDLNVDHRDSDSWLPKVNMEFDSHEEAYDFYNRYGGIVGFSIRKSRTRRDPSKEIHFRTFCCSKEGFKRHRKEDVRRRDVTRTGCMALMSVRKARSGKWIVVQFVQEHNHDLSKLVQTHMLRSQKKLKETRIIANNVEEKSGLRRNLIALSNPQMNFVHTALRKVLDIGEAAAILEYLRIKRAEDPSFIYEMQYDADCKITNIFWADARSTTDYHYFGDVVCFDSTSKDNSRNRPFGIFTGINHHKETVTFGAALLYDETVSSFEWLFTTFVKAMGGKFPKTMLTDRDKAMADASASVLPSTYHRVCAWHIYQTAFRKLGNVFGRLINGKKPFGPDFAKCIYSSEEEEFMITWQNLLDSYDLRENLWLREIFEEREKWALAYGRNFWYGDMKAAQQHERLTRNLRSSLESEENLMEFFDCYETILADQRSNELRADFKASQCEAKLSVPSPVLEQAGKVYTPAAFKAFQEEYVHIYGYHVVETFDGGSIKSSTIRATNAKCRDHVVKFDPSTKFVECSCKKFEFEGFLCRHAFTMFHHEGTLELPVPYIMRRWTKDAKVENIVDLRVSGQLDPEAEKVRRKNELFAALRKVSVEAVEYEESYKVALAYLDLMLQDVRRCKYRLDFQMLEGNASQDNLDSVDRETLLAEEVPKKKYKSSYVKKLKKKKLQNKLLDGKNTLNKENYSSIRAGASSSRNLVAQQVASLETNSSSDPLNSPSLHVLQLVHGVYSTPTQCSNPSQYNISSQAHMGDQVHNLY